MCLCLLDLTDASITEHQCFSLQMLMHKAIKRLYCTRPSRDYIAQGHQEMLSHKAVNLSARVMSYAGLMQMQ